MIARVTLLMLAGCSFTQGDLGGASGDAKRDGNGDGSPIRIDGSPDFDYDEDGFSDAVDNCMTITNTDQRDWDGDHVGDACDWCPHIASTANADGDGDMVGDLCDPRPAIAGDALALWTSFHDAGQITGWYSGGTGGIGVWSVSGMALAQSATDPLDFTSWASPNLYQRTYLATSFVLGTPNALATVGVCSGWDGSSFDCCNINTRKGAAVAEAQSGGPMQIDAAWPAGMSAGMTIDVVQDLTTGSNVCTFGGTASSTSMATAISARLLFYTGHTAAKFRYMFVVTIGS